MAEEPSLSMPDEFVQQVHDALLHYYDYAYLARHSLLERLWHLSDEDPTVAVMRLRKLLLMSVQQLRPANSLPPEHPAWRPYNVLHERCILGKDWPQVEAELSLSKRQLQREQQNGFQTVALALWNAERPAPVGDSGSSLRGTLIEEITRTKTERTTFDAGEQLNRALASAQSIASRYTVTLTQYSPETGILVAGNPLIFRQIVLSMVSLVIRTGAVRILVARLEPERDKVLCTLLASPTDSEAALPLLGLPTPLLTLVASQKAELCQTLDGGRLCLQVAWLPAERAPIVALVEDNSDLVNLVTRYLTSHGYRLVAVSPGPNVFERLTQLRPDAILLDIMMRDVDGWEILQKVRADPSLGHTPVAVCSILDEPDLAASLGADAYLHKPIRPAQFLQCVEDLLTRRARSGRAGSE